MARPSIGLVRAATDRLVLAHLLDAGRDTRAGIAVATGLSKPTVSEAIRRLAGARLVEEGGLQTGGRGRSGTWCRLADGIPGALAVHAGPGLVRAEVVDVRGATVHEYSLPIGAVVTGVELERALQQVRARVDAEVALPVGPRCVSVADPVDRRTGRVVHLEGSPFVVGDADVPAAVGAGAVVDNDVHWAAVGEREILAAQGVDSYAYLYLGPGMGGALVDDGRLVRGARGVAGELARVTTVLPDGSAGTLLEAMRGLGLVVDGGTAVDVEAVLARFAGGDLRAADAVGEAVRSLLALLDPGAVVVTGPWGVPVLRERLAERLDGGVRVLAGSHVEGAFPAARAAAVAAAREALLDASSPADG